ncbi:MAG: methylmalonyl Co-A mutase-associated GTPase MeaB [Betaproteobacteria bacterium]|nr:methylmalonyl Co-A mutase-associated GTPase MeaB [Betaproteobacteria bacterium]
MSGPLSGIVVLEVGHMLAGPYCGMLLADLGADVIKIEPPEGDLGRRVSPHAIGPHNAYFASLNRSKRSVVLDLSSPEGRSSLRGLAARAHALVANLRPAAIRKLGLTYEALKDVNPRLVCLALTGYGLEGGHAGRPAYDYVIQALTGVMAVTGEPGGPPAKTGYSAVDNSAGMMGAVALLSQIVEGRGGQIDVSLYDVMLSQLNYLAGAWLNAGERAQRMPRSAHPYIVPAQLFETRDGWLAVFVSHDEFWRRFCKEAGRPEWLEDARFATMAARRENRATVLAALEPLFRSDTTASWAARLAPLGVVAAPIETLEQALGSELARERDMIVEIGCAGGTIRAVGNPVKITGMRQEYRPPPLLGEHNAALLGERRAGGAGDRGIDAGPTGLAARILARDRRAIARAITAVENGTAEGGAISAELAAHRGHARVVGITGPPGCGKSTLVAALVKELIARGRRVAVVAVDPSSPFSGGALLGDRVRMAGIQAHEGVYIRSLASRGHHGGVSGATRRVVGLLDAAGFDYVLVETVGTGQSEVGVATIAGTRLVVCPPGLGDEVQTLKAGILEIADAFVVNKADLPGAERAELDLLSMLAVTAGGPKPPVFRTAAASGQGVSALAHWLEQREMPASRSH